MSNMEIKPMKILLIEDDIDECNNLIECVKKRKDIELVGITDSDTEGLKLARINKPEGIILDLELNNSTSGKSDSFEFIDKVKKLIDKKVIEDKVIVQAGFTKYQSKDMEIFDLIDRDKFNSLMKECDLLITHGGVGSILTGLKNGKKIIACPRLEKYNEHINDHQKQIIEKFSKDKYIIGISDPKELEDAFKEIKTFKNKNYVSNTHNMVKLISNFIDNN